MQETTITAEDSSLISRYDPTMDDYPVDVFTLHPEYPCDPDEGIEMLAASMEEVGQGRPIIARPTDDGQLEIVDGARTLEAARFLGWVAVTAVLLNNIAEEDVLPLMMALNSNNRKFTYKLRAKRFHALKKHAQALLKAGNIPGNEESDMTTRKYLQKILGFDNERYVSDFETVLKSPHCELLLDQLDRKLISFAKAVKKAAGMKAPPKPDDNTYKDKSGVYTCEDCPRRKAFLDKLDDISDAYTIDDLNGDGDEA